MYSTVIRFVVFVFLFHDLIAGFERLPKFPNPPLRPRNFSLASEPLDKGCVEERARCFAMLTACAVCFLQCGQYLFVCFGNFMVIRLCARLRMSCCEGFCFVLIEKCGF